MTDLVLLRGDARHLELADGSVQCIVTSPPYWGLRKYAGEQDLLWLPPDHPKGSDYPAMCPHDWAEDTQDVEIRTGLGLEALGERYRGGGKKQGEVERFTVHRGSCRRCGAWRGGYGLEPTIEMYIEHTIEILQEMWRVLRADGVLFWNIGDSYASDKGYSGKLSPGDLQATSHGTLRGKQVSVPQRLPQSNLKPKDMCLIPERVALAAQQAGWWVRSRIIWAKTNPMPESVTDRPTDSYEQIWMFTKSETYFWDPEAVREKAAVLRAEGPNAYRGQSEMRPRGPHDEFGYSPKGAHARRKDGKRDGTGTKVDSAIRGTHKDWEDSYIPGTRNMRNIWLFATQTYAAAHFATFPEELPRRCIRAATSERGSCIQCGAPWDRVIRVSGGTTGKSWHDHSADLEQGLQQADGAEIRKGMDTYERKTIGWRPTCLCRGQRGQTEACVVLDPFAGSGTTGRAAIQLNRRAVLNDLAYQELAEQRTSGVQRNLL